MIISHKHKFIFIKLRKTAGTSLEIALSGICGKDDIITPISAVDEEIRSELGYPGPQNANYFIDPQQEYWANEGSAGGKRTRFYNHMPAGEIMSAIPPEIWNSYFKFCFERNPWDKVISHYFHVRRGHEFSSIKGYLDHYRSNDIKGYDMYAVQGKVVVDRVFKYEEMDGALVEIKERLGLEHPLSLPEKRAKSGFRTDRRHYSDLLDEEDASHIATRYRREIEFMGYTF